MKKSHKLVLVALLTLGAFASQACNSSSDPEPSDPGPITPGTGGKQNNTGGKNGNTGGGSDTGGGSNTGGKQNNTGGADNLGGDGPGTGGTFEEPEVPPCPEEADDEQPSSSDAAGTACWNIKDCKGQSDEQFLEQCNGTCYPFDNAANIDGFTGTLPPL